MKTVLVPIDGSASAARALAFAVAELRQVPGARIHLLNVQAPMVQPWPGKLVTPDMINDELRREGAQVLAPALATVAEAGIACTTHVRIGPAAEEIADAVSEQGCDVVVMGTRGLGSVAGFVLGSVAARVVHLVALPVTLVK